MEIKTICSHSVGHVRHTSPFPPSGNEGYLCNRDVSNLLHYGLHEEYINVHIAGSIFGIVTQ